MWFKRISLWNFERYSASPMALTLGLVAPFGSRSRKTLDSPRANFPISCEIGYGKSFVALPKRVGMLEVVNLK